MKKQEKKLDLEKLKELMIDNFPNCNPVIEGGTIRATFGNCSMPLDFGDAVSEEEYVLELRKSLRLANYS